MCQCTVENGRSMHQLPLCECGFCLPKDKAKYNRQESIGNNLTNRRREHKIMLNDVSTFSTLLCKHVRSTHRNGLGGYYLLAACTRKKSR